MIRKKITEIVSAISGSQNRAWYYPAIALLAAADAFLWVIPADGVLISSTLLNRKRWIYSWISVTVGSTLGALAVLLVFAGLFSAGPTSVTADLLEQTSALLSSFQKNSFLFYCSMAAGPLPLQPTLYLPLLTKVPIEYAALGIFLGRMAKYLIFCVAIVYIVPKLNLKKMRNFIRKLQLRLSPSRNCF